MNQRFRPTKQIQKQIEAVFNQLHDEGYEWLEAFTKGEDVFVRGLGSDSVAEVKNRNDLLVNAQNFWQILAGRETGLETPEISSSLIKDSLLTALQRTHLALSLADAPIPKPKDTTVDATINFLKGSYNELAPLDALKKWAIECEFSGQEEIQATLVRALAPIIFEYFDVLEELKTHREAVSDESSLRASAPRKISPELLSFVDEAIKHQLTREHIKNLIDELYKRLSKDPNGCIGEELKDDTIRQRAAILGMKPLNSTKKNNTASKPMYDELQAKINTGHFDVI
jgi:hypothetical protein